MDDGIERTCECGHLLKQHPDGGACTAKILLPSARKVHVFELPHTERIGEHETEPCKCPSFRPTERMHRATFKGTQASGSGTVRNPEPKS